ncbi:DUF948 domain-containing protein [Cyanobacterium stanieri LEGE 03274]|uniref:DUF948 domain-containing protein n=1 Tax=Cyanobacterium stanieri LEGE 03274 TaxID=1828756 RepID=A0ABR9V2Z8_9CHRO|nr:DUF948 domain-containing protein [Cyanobacterium stanieri]MBE9221194.1 DUF948 domain-containing protein [Cyanobacterium stanieri LEGE 03274]
MNNPIIWLGLSFALVALSLTAVLIALIPVAQQLTNTARSAEKLLDTLNKEFPDTIESLKATNHEITQLTGEVKQGVKSVSSVSKQIDNNLNEAKKQINNVQVKSKSIWAGLKAGVKTWQNYSSLPEDQDS